MVKVEENSRPIRMLDAFLHTSPASITGHFLGQKEMILEKLFGRISYTFSMKCDVNETLDLEVIKGKLTLITHFRS
jgi:hypothetical protein